MGLLETQVNPWCAAGLPPVAAHLQRKGSTMAAEIARAASTPSGAAASAAAAREPPKPAGPGTVLVVPKKKQSSPPLRTPKKPAAAPAVRQQSASSHLCMLKLGCDAQIQYPKKLSLFSVRLSTARSRRNHSFPDDGCHRSSVCYCIRECSARVKPVLRLQCPTGRCSCNKRLLRRLKR